MSALASHTSSDLCSLQLHSSASRPILFVANRAWLLTRKRLAQIQLWSVVFQALPFHYSSEYKVGLHFSTQRRQSKHLLILGPKCLMHFSAELSETLRHWCRSVHWTLRHLDTSAPVHKCETFRHQTHSAEMSWVRSVLGPKCPYTSVCSGGRHRCLLTGRYEHITAR